MIVSGCVGFINGRWIGEFGISRSCLLNVFDGRSEDILEIGVVDRAAYTDDVLLYQLANDQVKKTTNKSATHSIHHVTEAVR